MAYDTTTYLNPFWATSADFVRGRDPLGIQNSSIAVYSLLLPGMTNLTLRLRYYGFYLWLLDHYHNLPNTNPFKNETIGQYNFVRRAELILAYIMINKFPDEQSVIGSDFAFKNKSITSEQSYYDIALGADKFKGTRKGSVYWDFKSGALGQYYVGSLISLHLVRDASGYFQITEKGTLLAKAFDESIDMKAGKLFLKRIEEGKLYLSDLDKLLDFTLNKEITNTAEEKFYTDMLLDPDGNSRTDSSKQRKETILLFLEFLEKFENEYNWKEFPFLRYFNYLDKEGIDCNDAELGWYYYYLNELVHYSMETIFWGMLMEMEKKSYSLPDFIEYIAQAVINYKKTTVENINQLTLNEVLEKIDAIEERNIDYLEQINLNVKNHETIEGITNALFFLLKSYKVNVVNFEALKLYATQYSLFDKNGNALAIFKNQIQSNLQNSFFDFIKNVIKTTINEHTAIAYRKMGNGEKNLLKFLLEDNHLVHIETMTPNFTSPRLKTLYNFTIDLGLVTKEGKLTNLGLKLINENA